MTAINNQENKYLHKVYRNICCLGILLHSTYSVMFGFLHYQTALYYNFIDIFFYASIMLLAIRKKKYSLAVSLIHLETILFCILHTITFGWEPTFYIYLIAMASLVYFCPFRSIYIPYLYSFLHIVVFFFLYVFSLQHTAHITPSDTMTHLFFICNTLSAFIIILYVGYVSKASASVGRKELIEQNKDLQHLANYDQMTGLYNRACLRNQYERFQSDQHVLAIGDIDDFKGVNDTYGHICGDIILKELAEQMRSKLDPNLFICRWGGEEFVIIFLNTTTQHVKQQLVEFCQWIEQYKFQYEETILHITMTFGISQGKNQLPLDKWVEASDILLYEGKHTGKNKVLSN